MESNSRKERWTDGVWIPVAVIGGIVLLFAISIFHNRYNSRVNGEIIIENDDFKIIDSMVCIRDFVYGGESEVAIECEYNDNSALISHEGIGQSCYTYLFVIEGEGKKIKSRLDFYEDDGYSPENWNLIIDIYQIDGVLNATITSHDGKGSNTECIDIETNGIALEYWSVGNVVQSNYRVDIVE